MGYREQIYALRLSRKVIAAQLGLTYAAFSSRLCGFTAWQDSEERELQKIIEQAEQAQRTERKSISNSVYRG
jgi:hypothetical protein